MILRILSCLLPGHCTASFRHGHCTAFFILWKDIEYWLISVRYSKGISFYCLYPNYRAILFYGNIKNPSFSVGHYESSPDFSTWRVFLISSNWFSIQTILSSIFSINESFSFSSRTSAAIFLWKKTICVILLIIIKAKSYLEMNSVNTSFTLVTNPS